MFLSDFPVADFTSAVAANNQFFNKYFHATVKENFLPPSALKAGSQQCPHLCRP
jgi:hypothetical protein